MIAELFYPKELKRIIRDLEAKGNLRREPLDVLNKGLVLVIYVTVFTTAAAVHAEGFLSGVGMFVLMSPFLFLIPYLRNNKFKAYVYGSKRQGAISKITYRYFQETIIHIILSGDQKKIKTARIGRIIGLRQKIRVGQEIGFFESEDKWVRPMPDIYEVKKYYCLRKDLMEK